MVPIVPGQARVMMMRQRRMQEVEVVEVVEVEEEVDELEEVEEEAEKEVEEEYLTRMENMAEIWCSMLGASWSCAID